MKSGSRFAAQGLAAALGAVVGIGCAEAPGELVLVVQTDLSLPDDIDTVRIEISRDGVQKFKNDFPAIGAGGITLPATLGVAPEDDPSVTATIRVSAKTQGKVRSVREVVTQIPEGKVTTLHVPVEFLCLGSAQPDLLDDEVVNACPKGLTCKAGVCKPSEITDEEAAALPEYAAAEVFGGGSGQKIDETTFDGQCFDVARCFQDRTRVPINLMDCTIEAPEGDDLNVAFETRTEGMCNSVGCFVALNAGIDSGWTRLPDGRIQLPEGACEIDPNLVGERTPLRYAAIASGDACGQKTVGLPTCGPWSAAGGYEPLPPDQPLVLASRQESPVGVSFDDQHVYWTVAGTFAEDTGEKLTAGLVMRSPLAGGPPESVGTHEATQTPRQIAIDRANARVYVALQSDDPTLGNAEQLWVRDFSDNPPEPNPTSVNLTGMLDTRRIEGIAVADGRLFWTDFGGGRVLSMTTQQQDIRVLQAEDPANPAGDLGMVHPFQIAASGDTVCWTNEGTFQLQNGSVVCAQASTGANLLTITGAATPRGIALDAEAVYWTSFDGGTVHRAARMPDGSFDPNVVEIASAQAFPHGVAVDDQAVYWTNWGDGTVWMILKSEIGNGAPTIIAADQRRPGTITVRTPQEGPTEIYWVNEGSPEPDGGSLVRLLRSAP